MKAKHNEKDDQRKAECNQSDDNIRKAIERSFFEWSDGMCVIRQGKGEIAMTEGELAKFFGVSWQKVNHKVKLIKQTMCLKPYEIEAGNVTSNINIGMRNDFILRPPSQCIQSLPAHPRLKETPGGGRKRRFGQAAFEATLRPGLPGAAGPSEGGRR